MSSDTAGRALGAAICVVVLVGTVITVVSGVYSMTETYGGGGWLGLVVVALVSGLVAGGALFGAARVTGRSLPLPVALAASAAALVLLALGAELLGARAHDRWVTAQANACDGHVGPDAVALGGRVGQLVQQDSSYSEGRDDGRCIVIVNLRPGADVRKSVSDAAAGLGWHARGQAWVSPHDVAVTAAVEPEPKSSGIVVELAARESG